MRKCSKCGNELYEGTLCLLCGYDNGEKSEQSTFTDQDDYDNRSKAQEKETVRLNYHPMKWYKTLLVILWIGMAANVVSALTYFSGSIYGSFAETLYKELPAMESLNMFCGMVSLFFAVWNVVVWYHLKNYKINGPKYLIMSYVFNMVFYVIELVALFVIVNSAETTIIYGEKYIQGMYEYQEYLDLSAFYFSFSDLFPIVVYIVIISLNRVYFSKRDYLFIH